MAERIATAVTKPPAERRERQAIEFPGCRPLRIPREEIADCDIRFEYWDADTEIAMICEPVSYYHERPAARLARLAGLIASARGAPIEAVGHTDLLVPNARGERQRIMQADQILFLRPAQAIPRGDAIEVGTDALPDVVLEVDNTTDVRRGKLGLYDSWGLPEVWVEVGAAEGTGPDDDPFLRRQLGKSHAAGHAEGRAEAQHANALKVLKARGISVSPSLSERLAEMAEGSERLLDAALECRDEEHFLRVVSARK